MGDTGRGSARQARPFAARAGCSCIVLLAVLLCLSWAWQNKLRSSPSATVLPLSVLRQSKGLWQPVVASMVNDTDIHSVSIPQKPPNSYSGHFVYMVTGRSLPARQWLQLSQQNGVQVLFAAWGSEPAPSTTAQYPNLTVYYYPKSTWSVCRNFLYDKAVEMERQRQQPFDFYLFADEDLRLGYQTAEQPTILHLNDPVQPFLWLQEQLQADRPARASVGYPSSPQRIEQFSAECVKSCAFDGVLDIYHQSVAIFMLPYSVRFEKTCWAMAQYTNNLRSQALMADYCHIYRQVFVDINQQEHAQYPMNYGLIKSTGATVMQCLQKLGIPVSPQKGEGLAQTTYRALKRPRPGVLAAECTRNAAEVNYMDVLDLAHLALSRKCT